MYIRHLFALTHVVIRTTIIEPTIVLNPGYSLNKAMPKINANTASLACITLARPVGAILSLNVYEKYVKMYGERLTLD